MKAFLVAFFIVLLGGALILRTYDVGRLDKQDAALSAKDIALHEQFETNRLLQLELIKLILKDERTEEDKVRIQELLDDLDRL